MIILKQLSLLTHSLKKQNFSKTCKQHPSFIYPHLIYRLEFWGHAPDYALEQVLICQKKAMKIICCQHRGLLESYSDSAHLGHLWWSIISGR